ncbi:MAG TPA: hypothetical protein VEW03_14185 [Longimicrobiaceae bacterium]|nr:hypothetical protein [Longimicrobiaceae bacterium]
MRCGLLGVGVAVVAVGLGAGALAGQRAQRVALSSGGAQRVDSVRALRSARSAQAAFERLRFRNLPWTDSPGSAGGCDERIGRFCIWHDDDESTPDWKPPPEPAAVRTGRDRLIAALDEAASASGDSWVAGQRVRYLVEAGRAADAARAARECRAARWWCLALEGYALHAGRDYVAAEAAFAAALGAMPAADRREWTDLTPLLADGDAGALRRMAAGGRDSTVRRLWWLADPFWTEPGNDRRAEHFARLVTDRFQDRARTTEGLFWADDLREIMLRYGVPTGWERMRPRGMQNAPPGVITHYAADAYEYLPTLRLARDPAAIEPGAWKLEDPRARTQYSSPSFRSLQELPHQLAVFRRGGRAEVVAAFRLEHDSLPAAPVLEAGLVLARDELAEPVLARTRVQGARGVLRASAFPEPALVSVEVREEASRHAGRARYAVDLRPPTGDLSLSDVLVLADADARPESLDAAAPLARGDTRLHAGERLGLFWEVYGLEAGTDSLTLSLALSRRDARGLRRTAERLGLARTATPVRMRWSEEVEGSAVLPRSLAIALPNLPPGDYAIEVSVRTGAGAGASTTREITVVNLRQ